MVRSFDLKSGDPKFKLGPLAGFEPASPSFNSPPVLALLYSKLVCLLPVGILNLPCSVLSVEFLAHNVNYWVYQ